MNINAIIKQDNRRERYDGRGLSPVLQSANPERRIGTAETVNDGSCVGPRA